MIRLATDAELARWDELIAANPDHGHIYQTFEWGEYKNQYKWRPLRLIFEDDGAKNAPGITIALQILAKNVRGMGRVYYCPKGPGFFADMTPDAASIKQFRQFSSEIRKFLNARDRKALILIVEPEALDGTIELKKLGYDKFRHDLQFKATILVDIDKSAEDLLASFKQKTRYNIRLAQKKAVQIKTRPADLEMLELMYKLMRATQKRAGFFLRPKTAFFAYWKQLAEQGMGQFLVAEHDGDVLAAVYVMLFNDRAYYKEGGSFALKRNLMAPHLLQYETMLWAHKHGARVYDMVAVPPKSRLDDAKHAHHGLYQFKSGFEPEVTEFIGCYDLVLNPRARVWLRTERYYNAIYSRIKKNLFY